MLALDLFNSTPLDLPSNASIPINITNSALDSSGLERVFSYSMHLPASPNNLAQLGYPNRINGIFLRVRRARLTVEGSIIVGVLEIQGVTDKIQCIFRNESIELKNKFDSTKLSDIEIPFQLCAPFTLVYTVQAHVYTDIDMINDVDHHYDQLILMIDNKVYQYPATQRAQMLNEINNDTPGLITDLTTDEEFVKWEINTAVAPNVQITIKPPEPDLPQFSNYAYFNNQTTSNFDDEVTRCETEIQQGLQATNTEEKACVFGTMYAPNAFDGNSPAFVKYINYYITDQGEYQIINTENLPFSDPPLFSDAIVPQVRYKSIVDAIVEYFSLSGVGGSFYQLPDFKKLVHVSNIALERVIGNYQHFTDRDDSKRAFIPLDKFNVTDFLPDWTVQEFFDALRSMFFFEIKTNDNKLQLNLTNNQLRGATQSITQYVEPNISRTLSSEQYFSVEFNRQDKEGAHPTQLQDIKAKGAPAKKYTVKLKPLPMTVKSIGGTWLVPEFNNELTSNVFNTNKSIDPIIMLFHGLHENSNGDTYPYLSHLATNFKGETVANFALHLEGEKGIVQQFAINRIKLDTEGEIITAIAHLPYHIIRKMQRENNMRVNIYNRNGQYSATIKNIAFNATPYGVSAQRLTMVKDS